MTSKLLHERYPFQGEVFFYYGLSNFYQNHRRYVKSRNDWQLLGHLDNTADCTPYETRDDKVIVPCGAIANSMFNGRCFFRLLVGAFLLTRQKTCFDR